MKQAADGSGIGSARRCVFPAIREPFEGGRSAVSSAGGRPSRAFIMPCGGLGWMRRAGCMRRFTRRAGSSPLQLSRAEPGAVACHSPLPSGGGNALRERAGFFRDAPRGMHAPVSETGGQFPVAAFTGRAGGRSPSWGRGCPSVCAAELEDDGGASRAAE